MTTIPEYPLITHALDGSEPLAGWQDGKQRAITTAQIATLTSDAAAAAAVQASAPLLAAAAGAVAATAQAQATVEAAVAGQTDIQYIGRPLDGFTGGITPTGALLTRVQNSPIPASGRVKTIRLVGKRASGSGNVYFWRTTKSGTAGVVSAGDTFTIVPGTQPVAVASSGFGIQPFPVDFAVVKGEYLAFYFDALVNLAYANAAPDAGGTWAATAAGNLTSFTVGGAVDSGAQWQFSLELEYAYVTTDSLKQAKADTTAVETRATQALGSSLATAGIATLGITAPDVQDSLITRCYAGPPVPRAGIVRAMSMRFAGAGTGVLFHVRPISGEPGKAGTIYQSIRSTPVTVAAGVNRFAIAYPVEKNDLVLYQRQTGTNVRYDPAGGAPCPSLIAANFTFDGATGALETTSPLRIAISYELEAVDNNVRDRLDAIGGTGTLNAGKARGPLTIDSQRFAGTTRPTNWSFSGAWTVNDGLAISGPGSWGTVASSGRTSTLTRRRLAARIRVLDAATIVGLGARPPSENTLYGGAVLIDGTDNKLKVHDWTGKSNGVLRVSANLPGPLVAGRAYLLEVIRDQLAVTARVTDTVTQARTSISYDRAGATHSAFFDGAAAIVHLAGSTAVEWVETAALSSRFPRVLIIGDSNTEGLHNAAIGATWAQQMAAASPPGEVAISAHGGGSTNEFGLRLSTDLGLFRPQFVMVSLVTNETDQTIWRANMAAIIAAILATGAEPVLMTAIPRVGSEALHAAMNVDIRTGYFGAYRYVDVATSLTAGNDGTTWRSDYNFGDSIHLNAAGQAAKLAQVAIDAPFVLA